MPIANASNASQLLQTALSAIDGYNAWNIEAILAPRAANCVQEILPKSLDRPLLNNDQYRAYFAPLLPAFSNFAVKITDVVEDPENHKVAIHASSTATTAIGPYANEYMLLFHMSENDREIMLVKEFVDSTVSTGFLKRLKEHLAQQESQKCWHLIHVHLNVQSEIGVVSEAEPLGFLADWGKVGMPIPPPTLFMFLFCTSVNVPPWYCFWAIPRMAQRANSQLIAAAAIGASAWLSGGMASISLLAIPALSESPSNSTLVKQFTKMYNIGRHTQPPATLVTSVLFFYAAYRNYGGLGSFVHWAVAPWKLLTAAGVGVLSVLPFTFGILEPTSHAIMDQIHYKDIERTDGQEVRNLVKRWGILNSIRATFPLLSVGFGACALLGQ